jgi:high-affinity iron transporter
MTVVQVVAWIAYLAIVVPAFARAGRPAPVSDTPSAPEAKPAPAPSPGLARARSVAAARRERLAARRPWAVAGTLVVPAVAALPPASAAATTAVTVSRAQCAGEWTSAAPGRQTFTVANLSGEIDLDNAAGGVVAEVETLGPATTATMTAVLGPGP